MAVLDVSNVTKVYNKRGGRSLTALDDVSFSVEAGEVVGFIGPNGAGKSTCIKCITGLATQTSGRITVCGFDTAKERVSAVANVGAIIENPDLYLNRTALENMRYFASISRIDAVGKKRREYTEERIEELLKSVGLFDRRNDKVAKYSLGMKQRLGIAQALLAEPKLLVLDEPTNGLDPMGIKEMRDVITALAHEKGVAVLISSHGLAELQQTCDRFLMIRKGKLLADFEAEDMGAGEKGTALVFTVDDVEKTIALVKEKFGAEGKNAGENKVEVIGSSEINAADVNAFLVQAGIRVSGLFAKRKSLEEVFVSLSEEGGKDVR